ncbi:G2-specific protein kinase [Venturia nashicola]|uniref:G2-specific protein kinase n=1 Tax=Venturia nashicola TaxID=86259 RepID=A0A4Z1P4S0_9PEZI|nr:G2-specific protein kinase [Venturia nashicola]
MYTVEVVNERETSGPSPRRTMQRSKTGRCEYASMNERSLDQVSRPRTTPYDRLEAVGDVSPVTSHHRGGVWRLSRKSSGSERAPEDGVEEAKEADRRDRIRAARDRRDRIRAARDRRDRIREARYRRDRIREARYRRDRIRAARDRRDRIREARYRRDRIREARYRRDRIR